jgi:hypothetical protein
VCRFNFHVSMVSTPTAVFTKADMDDADQDKRYMSD